MQIQKIRDPATQLLLAIVARPTDEEGPDRTRLNISPHTELLQVALIRNRGETVQTYNPHTHRKLPRYIEGTAEAWVVVAGVVFADVYTEAGALVVMVPLNATDIFVSYRGGHGFRVQPGACVVEIKNGPYYGHDADKEMISDAPAAPSIHSPPSRAPHVQGGSRRVAPPLP
jgi:hypothetical protein